MSGSTLTADEAKQILKLFGGYIHANECDYVQKPPPKAECTCDRAKLYAKLHEIAARPKCAPINCTAQNSR